MYEDLEYLLKGPQQSNKMRDQLDYFNELGGPAAVGSPAQSSVGYDVQSAMGMPHALSQRSQMPPSMGDAYQGAYGGMLGGMNQRDDRSPITAGSLGGGNYAMSGTMGGVPYQGATISPEANGTRPWDQFNTGLQPSPFMVKDNFMADGPIHTLGYSSRHGISSPTVDYSGMMQRAGIDRHNMDMSRMLGNQEIARGNANLDLQRMMLMSDDRQNAIGQRRQAEWDRMYTKTPAGQRASLIDRGEAEGHLPSAAAGEERISDMFSAASRAGKGFSKETGRPNDLEAFMRNVGQMYNPAKHDKYSIIRGLEGMGVTANTINALRGKPGMDNIINALIGDVQSVPMTRGAIDDFGLGLGRAFVPDISSLLR